MFKFKHFNIEQTVNAHKVGTDSMVLGAWTEGDFNQILDIGTGTGMLALMQAQKFTKANIIGIEPNAQSCQEAELNFKNSPFSIRLSAINSSLQKFERDFCFDLIISNPPYFVNSSLGKDSSRNTARHSISLSIEELYVHVDRLLDANGLFSAIFPSDLYEDHIKRAQQNNLYPQNVLIIENENGEVIRHLVNFAKTKQVIQKQRLIVKYSSGLYSRDYIELTKDFHNKVLPFKSTSSN